MWSSFCATHVANICDVGVSHTVSSNECFRTIGHPWASRAFKHRANSDVKHVVLLLNNVSVHNKWHSHINLHQRLLISLQNIATCKLQDRLHNSGGWEQHKYSRMSLSHLHSERGKVFSFLTARPDITMVTRLLCGCKWVAWTRCGGDVIMVKDAEDARVEKNTSQLKPCVACRRPYQSGFSPCEEPQKI